MPLHPETRANPGATKAVPNPHSTVIPVDFPVPQAIQGAVLRASSDGRAGGRIARGLEKAKGTVAFAPQSARANKRSLSKAAPAWSKWCRSRPATSSSARVTPASRWRDAGAGDVVKAHPAASALVAAGDYAPRDVFDEVLDEFDAKCRCGGGGGGGAALSHGVR